MEDEASSALSSLHTGSVGDKSGSGKSDARSQAVKVEETESSYHCGKDEATPERENGTRRKATEERKNPRGGESSCSSTNEQFSKRTKRRSRKVQRSVKDDAKRAVKHWTSPHKSDSVALYRWSLSASSDTLQQQQDLNMKTTDSVRIVAAVLAFQRWRQYQLKKLFNHELRKATRGTQHDDKSLANLEQEIANRDLHLARALSDMAQMRAQLSSTNRPSARDKQQNADELQKRLAKAQQRASESEQQLRKLEAENKRLSQSLKMMEEEARRVDCKLHGDIARLQSEKEGALGEVRVLLDQLARRDEELGSRSDENEKLRSALVRVAERQASQEKSLETLKLEQKAEIKSCTDQLKQAHGAKLAAQMELASCTERCNGLLHDKEHLELELQRVAEQADHSSRHAKELQERLNSIAETHAKASEDVAAEMIEHLKTLTEHMKELESTVDKSGHRPGSQMLDSEYYKGSKMDSSNKQRRLAPNLSGYQEFMSADLEESYEFTKAQDVKRRGRRAGKQGGKRLLPPKMGTSKSAPRTYPVPPTISSSEFMLPERQLGSDQRHETETCQSEEELDEDEEAPLTASGKQMILFKDDDALPTRITTAENRQQATAQGWKQQDNPTKWVTWKWKWAVAEAKAHGLWRKMRKFEEKLATVLHGRSFIARHKLVPLVLSAWRSYAKMRRLKRKTRRSQQALDGLMAAMPWWIRRVGERRRLERIFSFWQRLALRSGKRRLIEERLLSHCDDALEIQSQTTGAGPGRFTRPCSPHHVHFSRTRHRVSPNRGRKRSPAGNVQVRGLNGRNQKGQGYSFFQACKQPPGSNLVSKHDLTDETSIPAEQERAADRGNLGTPTISRALRSLQEELRDLRDLVSREVSTHHQARVEEPGKTGYKYLHKSSHMRETAPSAKRSLDAIWDVCNDLALALGEAGKQLQGFELGQKPTRTKSKSPVATKRTPITSGFSFGSRRNNTGNVRCPNTGAGTVDQDRSKPDSRPVDCVVQISRDCSVKVEPMPSPDKSPITPKRSPLPRSCARSGTLVADDDHCMGAQYADLLKSEIYRLKDGNPEEEIPCAVQHHSLPLAPPPAPAKKPPWSKY